MTSSMTGVAEISSLIRFNPRKMDASSTQEILFSSLLPKKIELTKSRTRGQGRIESDDFGNLSHKADIRVKKIAKSFVYTLQGRPTWDIDLSFRSTKNRREGCLSPMDGDDQSLNRPFPCLAKNQELGIEKNGVRPKLGEVALFLQAKVEVIDSLPACFRIFCQD